MGRTVEVDEEWRARLRDLRQARGLSQRDLGRRALSSKTQISDFETGKACPTEETVKLLDDALGAAGELVRLAQTITIPRRQAVQLGLAAMAGGLASSASPHRTGRVGSASVDRLQRRAARLRRLDDLVGGADTYRVYLGEVAATEALLADGSYSDDVGRQLLCLLAEQAQQAGWAAFDAGWQPEAERLYRLSLAAAEQARNTARTAAEKVPAAALAGNALALLAYQLLALRRPASELAIEACRTAGDDVPASVRALLNERCAWALAMAGRGDAAAGHMDIATAAAVAHGPGEPDWSAWVDATEVEIMRGRVWSVLQRPIRAIRALEDALEGMPETHARDKALYTSWLADAYVDAGEPEKAVELAIDALDLADGVASVRPWERIEAVSDRLPAELQAGHDLRERLAATRPAVPSLPAGATRDTPALPGPAEWR
ncbi:MULTISPECIES: helix-turn-helix domain-containing protein [Catenuloplanes]|uniref:Transcriptional regulator with XRE-family HTH domain n=1 Tax=Catenuloplanes niger TaxID=587534 RepID=A0AAE3ZQR1_9ACTN|nr:helix-turn-helix transcriptional regulator [Catenuloplanes niger]MDR7323357.1 transcriptional regulator with XRE-family HTH domain [Catenuloplanes niger]